MIIEETPVLVKIIPESPESPDSPDSPPPSSPPSAPALLTTPLVRQHSMIVLGGSGSQYDWDPSDNEQVASVAVLFKELHRTHLAYRTSADGGAQGEVIREFDPEAERIMLIPQLVGG